MKNICEVRKKVMTIGNKIHKAGTSLKEALKLAWYLVKKQSLNVYVKGTSYGKRQIALSHLLNYSSDQIQVYLVREPKNSFDNNAVAVIINVLGKGTYKLGYISNKLSSAVSILIDRGFKVAAEFGSVVGGPLVDMPLHYGLKISIQIA